MTFNDTYDMVRKNIGRFTEAKLVLNEELSREEFKKKIKMYDDEVFDHILSFDPTATEKNIGKYTNWLIKMYTKNKSAFSDDNNIKELLTKFDKVGSSLKRNNINKYNNIKSLEDVLKDASQVVSTDFIDLGSKVVYKDNDWVVEIPQSYEQSCEAYEKTTWCTADPNKPNFWKDYKNKNATLYVVRNPTKEKPLAQFAVIDKDITEVNNGRNHPYDVSKLFKTFPKVKNFFKKVAPVFFEFNANVVKLMGRKFTYKKNDKNEREYTDINISDMGLEAIPNFDYL